MSKRRRTTAGVLLAVAGLAALTGCGRAAASSDGETRYVAGDGSTIILPPSERDPARPVAGTTLTGAPLDLASWRGDVVVVNLWASWCGPCRSEAAALENVATDTASRGVRFVGLVPGDRDSRENAQAFVRRFQLSYPTLYDQDSSVLLAFRGQLNPSAVPTTLVLDREGRVAARALGEVDRSRLLGLIEPLLREQASTSGSSS